MGRAIRTQIRQEGVQRRQPTVQEGGDPLVWPPSLLVYSPNSRKGWFFSFPDVRVNNFECISFQGDSNTLKDLILKEYSGVESIFVDRGETVLHSDYGGYQYWAARRSMRYAPHLIEIAAKFRFFLLFLGHFPPSRQDNFNSADEKDKTLLPPSWKEEKPSRTALGGDYICAHWRRRDFVRAHGKELPSIKGTAKIVSKEGVK